MRTYLCKRCGVPTPHKVPASSYDEASDSIHWGRECSVCGTFARVKSRQTKKKKQIQALMDKLTKEDVAANNIGGGQVAMFNPVIRFKSKNKKVSELIRRWLQGR